MTLSTLISSYDNKLRAERSRMGKLNRVRQGGWLGGPPHELLFGILSDEDVQNKLDKMKREKEFEITGFPYHRNDITREELIEKYGKDLVEGIDESHGDGWLHLRNDYDHRLFVEKYQHIPMGLEKKISLGWFMHFFSWMQMDTYSVDIEGASFHGNWLDVPYPYADEITLWDIKRDLPDHCYNWYELFVIINDMMWEQGRCLDIGITGVRMDIRGKRVIVVDWSS